MKIMILNLIICFLTLTLSAEDIDMDAILNAEEVKEFKFNRVYIYEKKIEKVIEEKKKKEIKKKEPLQFFIKIDLFKIGVPIDKHIVNDPYFLGVQGYDKKNNPLFAEKWVSNFHLYGVNEKGITNKAAFISNASFDIALFSINSSTPDTYQIYSKRMKKKKWDYIGDLGWKEKTPDNLKIAREDKKEEIFFTFNINATEIKECIISGFSPDNQGLVSEEFITLEIKPEMAKVWFQYDDNEYTLDKKPSSYKIRPDEKIKIMAPREGKIILTMKKPGNPAGKILINVRKKPIIMAKAATSVRPDKYSRITSFQTYKIQEGDCLYNLAYKFWKNRKWRLFLDYNDVRFYKPKGYDAYHLIKTGQELIVPVYSN